MLSLVYYLKFNAPQKQHFKKNNLCGNFPEYGMKRKQKFIIVIPARYKSSRFPGKPLINILGVPMLKRTYLQCLKVTEKKNILVATDHKKIAKFCSEEKINFLMTSKKCLTGTDRVAEVAKKIKADFYINVQGDEPLCNTSDIKKLINYAKKYPKEIINGYTEIKDKKLFYSGHIPKVVFRKNGKLLYQSRAAIPTTKEKKFIKAWRQVCIYSMPRSSLKIFSSIRKKTILESIEDCELMRFLELGLEVKMIKMSDKSIAVDNPKDILKVERILKKKYKN